jgi:hypothetical protein
MTIWRGRQCRAAVLSALRVVGVGLFGVAALAVPGMAATEGRTDDPRDVGLPVDLRALTHTQDGRSIVYTAETYAPFSDQSATFKWGIDRDRDEAFDLIVFTEWRDGKLVGGVTDPAGGQVAPASVSRPGPAAIRVVFPAEVLGDGAAYRYAVSAGLGGAERDLYPNTGLVQHRLGVVTAGPNDVRTAASASATPAPSPQATSPAPAPAAAAAAPAPASATTSNLPRTGPGERALLPWSGLALIAGGAFVALGARRSRLNRGQALGGIR